MLVHLGKNWGFRSAPVWKLAGSNREIINVSLLLDSQWYKMYAKSSWIFQTIAGISSKNWPVRDEDRKHLKSFATVLKYQLIIGLSSRKTYLLNFNIKGSLQTRITNTGIWEQQNSYNVDKDFNTQRMGGFVWWFMDTWQSMEPMLDLFSLCNLNSKNFLLPRHWNIKSRWMWPFYFPSICEGNVPGHSKRARTCLACRVETDMAASSIFVLLWDLVRICIRVNYLSQVRDLPSSNMLEAAISVSTLQARHVRARFECSGTLPSHSSLIWESHTVQRGAGLLSLLLR